jgi:hypothetical protein
MCMCTCVFVCVCMCVYVCVCVCICLHERGTTAADMHTRLYYSLHTTHTHVHSSTRTPARFSHFIFVNCVGRRDKSLERYFDYNLRIITFEIQLNSICIHARPEVRERGFWAGYSPIVWVCTQAHIHTHTHTKIHTHTRIQKYTHTHRHTQAHTHTHTHTHTHRWSFSTRPLGVSWLLWW